METRAVHATSASVSKEDDSIQHAMTKLGLHEEHDIISNNSTSPSPSYNTDSNETNDNSNPQQGNKYSQDLADGHRRRLIEMNGFKTNEENANHTNLVNTNGGSKPVFKVPPFKKDGRKLFVGGIPSVVSDDEFREYFEQFGRVIDSVVMYDRDTHRSRGFGFITFEDITVAETVLEMAKQHENKVLIKGRSCEVKAAEPKASTQDGQNLVSAFPSRRKGRGPQNNPFRHDHEMGKPVPPYAVNSTAYPSYNGDGYYYPNYYSGSPYPQQYIMPPYWYGQSPTMAQSYEFPDGAKPGNVLTPSPPTSYRRYTAAPMYYPPANPGYYGYEATPFYSGDYQFQESGIHSQADGGVPSMMSTVGLTMPMPVSPGTVGVTYSDRTAPAGASGGDSMTNMKP